MRSVKVLAFAALALSVGCERFGDDDASGADAGPSGGGATPGAADTPAAFSAELARLFCANLAGCCDAAPAANKVAACGSAFSARFDEGNDRRAAVWDAALAQTCLTQVLAAPQCAPLAEFEAATQACAQVSDLARGTAAEGEACAEDLDCAEPEGFEAWCDGVCKRELVSAPRAAVGDACGETCTDEGDGASSCEGLGDVSGACYTNDGLYCAADNRCAAAVGAGESCQENRLACGAGLYCDGTRCVAKSAIGEACSFSSVCASGRCDREAGVCAERAPAGATCDDSGECADGLTCGLDPDTFVGTCKAEGGGNDDRAERCALFDQIGGP